MIKILKNKAKCRRIQRRVPKFVFDLGQVWEAKIYSRTAGKDGRTHMQILTGDTINKSEWMEFEFYDLCCIGKIGIIRQKSILAYGLEFHIR